MTMYYVGQKIIVGYMSLKNTLFQKPTFEWVWRLQERSSHNRMMSFRSPHLSGYGDKNDLIKVFHFEFQKPTFEWVWRLQDYQSTP